MLICFLIQISIFEKKTEFTLKLSNGLMTELKDSEVGLKFVNFKVKN